MDAQLIHTAFELYKRTFDKEFDGFGDAPKFSTPHNLLFLMQYYEKNNDEKAMEMVGRILKEKGEDYTFRYIRKKVLKNKDY